jgi:hypothetical protein
VRDGREYGWRRQHSSWEVRSGGRWEMAYGSIAGWMQLGMDYLWVERGERLSDVDTQLNPSTNITKLLSIDLHANWESVARRAVTPAMTWYGIPTLSLISMLLHFYWFSSSGLSRARSSPDSISVLYHVGMLSILIQLDAQSGLRLPLDGMSV